MGQRGLGIASMSTYESVLTELATTTATFTNALRKFAAVAAEVWPEARWLSILDIDLSADATIHAQWLSSVLTEEPPGERVNALWFGLFESAGAGGRDVFCAYVAGTSKPMGERDWNVRPTYWPRERYAPSTGLQLLSARLLESAAVGEARLAAILGYSILLFREVTLRTAPQLLVSAPICHGAVVGFDEGDFVALPWPPIGSASQSGT